MDSSVSQHELQQPPLQQRSSPPPAPPTTMTAAPQPTAAMTTTSSQQQLHQHPVQPHLFTHLPPSTQLPVRTSNSTPLQSPGLFSPNISRHNLNQTSFSEATSPLPEPNEAPFLHPLHPLQHYKVRE